MGMMAKMRSLAPWFIITVGGLFVIFMVLSDSKISDVVRNRNTNVGSINGKDISYQEYSQLVEQYRNYRMQTTGQDLSETEMSTLRDQVWDQLVSQRLVEEKIKEYDIQVTDEEIRDAILGPNPPAFLTQYFIDSTGQFNRQAYDAQILNPQNKTVMIQVEEQVRQQKLQEKLRSTINASASVTEDEIKRKFEEQNIKISAEYLLVRANGIKDDEISFTEADAKDYYKEHKDEFKQDAERNIKYVLFRTAANTEDSNDVKKTMQSVAEKLKKDAGSFKTYVETYSDKPYSKDTLQLNRIPVGAQDAIVEAKDGEIVGPVLTYEGYAVYRVSQKLRAKDQIVKASHILVKEEAQANEIFNRVNGGEDFAKVAKEVSEDKGSAVRGGDLGWFGKNQMVTEFENACFKGRVNQIQKPVKTQFGYHIIKVTGKSSEKYVIEKIVEKIEASPTTIDNINQAAEDFAYLAEENGFEKTAQELDYQVIEARPFNENARVISGLGMNSAIVRYSFENDVDDIGPVFKVPSGYAVVMVSGKTKEGYKSFEDVTAEATRKAKIVKKQNKALEIVKEIKTKLGNNTDLNAGKEVYANAKVASVQNFGPYGNVPTLGQEYKFSSMAAEIEKGKVSEAFIGNAGAFVIKVTSRTDFDEAAYSLKKISIRDNIMNVKKAQIFSQWLEEIKEEADIEDSRYLFFR